jgi:predicted ATPase
LKLDLVATVKFTAVVREEVLVTELREGTMNAVVWTGKECPRIWKEVKVDGEGMGMVKG